MNHETNVNPSSVGELLYVTALSHEAKPLIKHLQAKLVITQLGFKLYQTPERQDQRTAILVTGSGRLAMAAGLAWAQHYLPTLTAAVNIGIAGHGSLSVGQAMLVIKAQDRMTQKVFYPHPIVKWQGVYSAICTLDQPSRDYQQDCGYDMEASAFFETARRFLNAEAVQSIKVISDNPEQDYTQLTPQIVVELITEQLDSITTYTETLRQAAQPSSVNYDEQWLQAIEQKWSVSVSQRQQLVNLLTAQQVLAEHAETVCPQIDDYQQLKPYMRQFQQWVQRVQPCLPMQGEING